MGTTSARTTAVTPIARSARAAATVCARRSSAKSATRARTTANGPSGTATGGPPGEAGQSLPQFPLKVEKGLLYIEVPLEELAMGEGEVLEKIAGPPGPGHDPCLYSCSIRRA